MRKRESGLKAVLAELGDVAPQTPQGFSLGAKSVSGGKKAGRSEDRPPFTLPVLDGARVAPQQSPILRPGTASIARPIAEGRRERSLPPQRNRGRDWMVVVSVSIFLKEE